jgi:hypothetical protein
MRVPVDCVLEAVQSLVGRQLRQRVLKRGRLAAAHSLSSLKMVLFRRRGRSRWSQG